MLSKKDKEEVLRLRQEEGLAYDAIHEKTNFSINTIMGICKGDVEESQKEADQVEKSQKEEAKKQEVHFDDPIEEMRAIPETIDKLIKTEQLKEGDRAEWEKRIEDIKNILRIEVDERIAGEREDAVKKTDEIWKRCLKDDYVEKEIAENKDTTIKGLTKTIDEKNTTIESLKKTIGENNDLITNLSNKNIDLNNKNIALEEYKEKYLEGAGRRERRRLKKERGDFIIEKTEFKQYVQRKQTYFRDVKEDLDNKIREEKKIKKENTERKKELDEREKGLNMLKNEIEQLQQQQKNNDTNANHILGEIEWRQTLLNKTIETARNKMIRDAIGPETIKIVPA